MENNKKRIFNNGIFKSNRLNANLLKTIPSTALDSPSAKSLIYDNRFPINPEIIL